MSRKLIHFSLVLVAFGWVSGTSIVLACDEPESITFLVTSDSHYEAIDKVERNEKNLATIRRMNEIAEIEWPANLGGGKIETPRGVLVLGDLIDDGDKRGETDIEWEHFTKQFGLDGTDGDLSYPVFEGWGNHDGPPEQFIKQRVSVQSAIKKRNQTRLEKKLISRVSSNGLHYSWDWNSIHFIQTNLYPADTQNTAVKYSLPWHDPQNALAFVKEDLAETVGDSGRPVVIMAHCGFDTNWWVEEDWNNFYQAVKPYNLIAYFHGHTGTGVRKWKPAGETKELDVVNTGQTEKGFFVVEISSSRMRLAYHIKRDPKELKETGWDWKFLLEKNLDSANKGNSASSSGKPAIENPITPTREKESGKSAETRTSARTSPQLSPSTNSVRFAVIGDYGLDNLNPVKTEANSPVAPADQNLKSGDAIQTTAQVRERRNPREAAVADLVHSWAPHFVLTTGDNNYPKGEAATIDENIGKYYSSFIGNYRGNFGNGAAENRFFPVLGNHDWDASQVRCQAYIDYFSLPGNERYYDFVQGPVHFFMLDTDGREPDGNKIDSKQYQWFVRAIQSSATPFQVVVAHHPPYSSGDHGGVFGMDWHFAQLGVDLVLNGHDHNYERIEKNDVVYAINGAGGANLREFKYLVSGSKVRYKQKHGAMLIEASRDQRSASLQASFVNIDGKLIDLFTINRTAFVSDDPQRPWVERFPNFSNSISKWTQSSFRVCGPQRLSH